MTNVAIVGAGFAGLFAVRQFAARISRGDIRVTIYDTRKTSDFLPLLPDVAGGRIRAEHTAFPIAPYAAAYGAHFIQEEVCALNPATCVVATARGHKPYDFLLICAGTKTTFFGHDGFGSQASTLDSMQEARALHHQLVFGPYSAVVVIGGGYTGLEVATQARMLFRSMQVEKPVHLVEIGEHILPGLPAPFVHYAETNLDRLEVTVHTEASLKELTEDRAELTTGLAVERPLTVWCAGKAAATGVEGMDVPKSGNGRLNVDPFLRLNDRCFAAGDAANVVLNRESLRMSIQFAISGGVHAARNILRTLDGRQLKPFKPPDLGYVLPMANWHSCGKALGVTLYGRLPSLLHYFMSGFRSFGMRNRIGVVRDLFSRRPVG